MSRRLFRRNKCYGTPPLFPLSAVALICFSIFGSIPEGVAQGIRLQNTSALNLNFAKKLDDSAPNVSDGTSTYLSAYRMDGASDEELNLYDNAEVRRGGVVLRGDKITYTFSTDEVVSRGNALVARNGAVFEGPELVYRLDAQTGNMPNAHFLYIPNRLRGTSDKLEFLGDGKARFCNAIITTCQEGDDSWWISADSIDLDQTDETAVGENAKLYVGGIPIFATPYLSFPVTSKRKSGFLTPKFGMSSTLGVNFSAPYYWNIAPNYDYTITPQPMTKRGILLGNEFRYLQPNFGGQITYDILWKDRELDRKRYGMEWQHYWKHSSGLSFGADYNRVSDDDYISDFSSNLRESSESVLPQNFWLSYGRTYWSTSLRVSKNQTLHIDGVNFDKPYEKLPEYSLNGYVADFHGFVLSSRFTATRFVNGKYGQNEREKPSGDGVRTLFNNSISYPMQGPFWFITPKVEYSMAWYNMDIDSTNRNYVDETSRRFLPIYSIDAGLIFERETSILGRLTEQTLEPRLYYAYIPYRNQSRMPNFDSSSVDMNFGQLFSPNIYTGWDRIAEANQLSGTVTTRLLDSNSGEEWFNATVGQRYYFSDQRVHLGFTNTQTKAMKSDLLFATQFSFFKDLKVEAGAQYSTQLSRMSKASVGARYTPKENSVIGVYYRYNYDRDIYGNRDVDNDIKQLDFQVQWPVSQDLYVLGRYNYSFYDKKGIESILGLEYRAGCWTLRTAIQQYTTSSSEKTTSFFLELELLGFGSFGVSPIAALRDNITGYQPIGPQPVEVGRYDYYE
ncbi:MAG: LPS-assembly protein LptD [Burkholderiaceae bacterium]|nr:LPS-assembly protein LptD [Burkholderiaceae bacterium]